MIKTWTRVHAGAFVCGAVAAVSIVGAGIVGIAVPAQAASPSITLSATVGPPTKAITAAGLGFQPSESVDLKFDSSTIATTHANASGQFTGAKLAIPATAKPGQHSIQAVGRTSLRKVAATFRVRTDWPQFAGGPRHPNVNETENALTAATVGRVKALWGFALPGGHTNTFSIYGGLVLLSDSDGYAAIDAATGALRWKVDVPSGAGQFTPIGASNAVYVTLPSGLVQAVDARSGQLIWSRRVAAGFRGEPSYNSGILYVNIRGADGGSILGALNAATGDTVWTHPFGYSSSGSPTIAGGRVFFATIGDHTLWSLDATSGSVLWQYDFSSAARTDVARDDLTATAAGTLVYVGLDAVDARTGARKWSQSNGRRYLDNQPIGNGVLYSTCLDGPGGYCLFDAVTGVRRNVSGSVMDLQHVANGVLYGTDGESLIAVDLKTGARVWSPFGTLRGKPVVADGRVYAMVDGFMTAYGP